MIRQLTLARRASLKLWISRTPSPPSPLDFIIVFQEIRDIPRVPAFGSHQNRVKADCIRLQSERGSLKHCIVWFGMADKTALRSTSFPAGDRCLVYNATALCLILSTKDENRSFFFLPKCSGTPRYLPAPPSFSIPSPVFYLFL